MVRDQTNWLYDLKPKIISFLRMMKCEDGFYKYSLSGDLYDQTHYWGLGNTVFAIRLLKMFDSLDQIDLIHTKKFVFSFQKKDGHIYDDFLHKKALFYNFLSCMKNLDIKNINRKNEKLAESRQAFSLLFSINSPPPLPFLNFPKNTDSIDLYLSSFNWKKPWHAGSHFSHLVFFLFYMKKYYPDHFEYNSTKLISYAIDWIDKLQMDDGSWYNGKTTLREKINGAMKIVTGFNVINQKIEAPQRLIDLALVATNDRHACDNFNVTYVLYNCAKQLNFKYRQDEILNFFFDRLSLYKEHYHEKIGGFSFFPNKTNIYYYKAKVTRGLNEPDIHGTLMFTWGISLIAEVLKIDKEIGITSFNP
ncbi:MAG: hypothetical protein ACFE9S_10525 [Candidatus Hermodarchaeota archaeon]